MRILHLVHSYAPEAHGGTQSYVGRTVRAQRERGHEVGVITGSEDTARGRGVERLEVDGAPVFRITRDFATERLSGDLGSEPIGRMIVDIVREFRPDLAHLHHWHALDREAISRIDGCGVPVVASLHDLFITCPRHFRMPDARRFCETDVALSDCARCVAPDLGGAPLDWIEARLDERLTALRRELGVAKKVLCMSERQRAFLKSLARFADLEALVLSIGVPRASFEPFCTAPRRSDRLRLVNWAGLDPRKGAHLLAAAAALPELRDRVEVHFHGKDGDPAYMAELREAASGAAVFFHGRFSEEDRAAFPVRYDVAVFPFLAFETHGLAVDEALAAGMPVIVCDRGAPETRLGGRGLSFRTGDVGALGAAIASLLDDPDRLQALRDGEPRILALEEHIEQLEGVYRAVLGDPNSGRS